MTTFELKSILVPLDGSDLAEQAIPFAVTMAGRDARLTFVQVLPDPAPLRDMLGRVSASEKMGADAEQRAKASLAAAGQHWASILATEPEVVVRTGDPASEILDAATRLGCDLIVAASRGRGAIGRLAFGSVADRLARAATVPVLIVRPVDATAEMRPALIRRLLVPYDGSDHAKEAFPVAISLAARLEVPIHVARVITPASYTPLAGPMEPLYSPRVLDDILSEIEAEAKRSIDLAVAELTEQGARATGEVRMGLPAATLQELAVQGDLVVMTSHGRSGVMRWLLGSVAEQLVREGPAPVLLVPARARVEAAMAR